MSRNDDDDDDGGGQTNATSPLITFSDDAEKA